MKKIIFASSIFFISCLLLLAGCSKEAGISEKTLPFLGGDTSKPIVGIDDWIRANLVTPFNIDVKYKYDEFEAANNVILVPIIESKVVPSLSDMKSVWIDPYVTVAGEAFMKTYAPKNITMIGSPAYNTNGTIVLGVAEGGLKILLYDMNRYDAVTNPNIVREKMHTIHHEFGHILNQNKLYPPAFKLITVGDYTGNWNLISTAEANQKGFVTPYSMAAADEDFVEMVATMLVEGKDYFENLKQTLINNGYAAAAGKLAQKEQFVIAYYKDSWGIDFATLQEKVRLALKGVLNPPPPAISTWYGYNKYFASLKADSTMMKTMVGGNVRDSLAKMFSVAQARFNLRVDSITVAYISADTILLRTKCGPRNTLTTTYYSDYRFKVTTAASGIITFGAVVVNKDRDTPSDNADQLRPVFSPLYNYLSAFPQRILWNNDPPAEPITSSTQQARFASSTVPASYFTGVLSFSKN